MICWSSVAEDAAARSFALGFYDAVGAMISSGDAITIELCFWAGLERFTADGFRLGDPSHWLHPPGHPHCYVPDFTSVPQVSSPRPHLTLPHLALTSPHLTSPRPDLALT